jgi:EF hand
MKTTIALLSVMALAGSLSFGREAPVGAPKGPRGPAKERPNPGELFNKLDTSGDGQVSLEEFKAGPMGQRLGDKAGEVFNKIDADSSGGITMEEFKAFRPERRGKGGPGRPGRPGRPGGDLEPPPAPVE